MDTAFRNTAADLDLFKDTETYILIHLDEETDEVSIKLGFKDGNNAKLKIIGLLEIAKTTILSDL